MKQAMNRSKQTQEDEKKEDDHVNNDELFPRSLKTLKQSDMKCLNHGDRNENVNHRSKYIRQYQIFDQQ